MTRAMALGGASCNSLCLLHIKNYLCVLHIKIRIPSLRCKAGTLCVICVSIAVCISPFICLFSKELHVHKMYCGVLIFLGL